jgi:diguanylate cyclase (GGDEF)-like protein
MKVEEMPESPTLQPDSSPAPGPGSAQGQGRLVEKSHQEQWQRTGQEESKEGVKEEGIEEAEEAAGKVAEPGAGRARDAVQGAVQGAAQEGKILTRLGSRFPERSLILTAAPGSRALTMKEMSKGKPLEPRLFSARRGARPRQQAQEKPGESEARYQAMVEALDGLIYISSGDYELKFLNQRFIERLGFDAVGQKCYQALHNLPEICPWCARDLVLQGETVHGEALRFRDNRWYLCISTPIRHAGSLAQLTMIQDITARQLAEETTRWLAYHDQLTGLPNRFLFNDRLTMVLSQAQRHRQKVAVMLLDLDRFKDINDHLGHLVGDALLKGVAQRLTGVLRQSDTVARLGGDEFILLSAEVVRVKDVTKVARKILEAFGPPFTCEGLEMRVTASIGVALYPDHGRDIDTLVKHADIAMYRAKKAGRNNYQMFPGAKDGKGRPLSGCNPLPAPSCFLGEEA